MSKNKVSGWYTADLPDEKEKQQVEEWYDKIIQHDYRGVSVEAPSKMILALGKLAQEEELSFQDFVEKVLADYLHNRGIDWKNP